MTHVYAENTHILETTLTRLPKDQLDSLQNLAQPWTFWSTCLYRVEIKSDLLSRDLGRSHGSSSADDLSDTSRNLFWTTSVQCALINAL